jgi:hypothetical protein
VCTSHFLTDSYTEEVQNQQSRRSYFCESHDSDYRPIHELLFSRHVHHAFPPSCSPFCLSDSLQNGIRHIRRYAVNVPNEQAVLIAVYTGDEPVLGGTWRRVSVVSTCEQVDSFSAEDAKRRNSSQFGNGCKRVRAL